MSALKAPPCLLHAAANSVGGAYHRSSVGYLVNFVRNSPYAVSEGKLAKAKAESETRSSAMSRKDSAKVSVNDSNAYSKTVQYPFAVVLTISAFPLIWVGGLVTTYGAGMAVPDWPGT